MLALNRSLLNRECTLMNVLKALASIISMCNLQVTFLSKTTPRYFALFTNGILRPFSVREDSGGRQLVHFIYPRHGPHRKSVIYYCVFSFCWGKNVSTELLPSNGCCTVACYLAMVLRVTEHRCWCSCAVSETAQTVQIMKPLIMNCPPVTPNIPLSTLFWHSLGLRSTSTAKNISSHTYKTTGNKMLGIFSVHVFLSIFAPAYF
jgi:hypothetical protein